jgi:molybdate transport system regulatory protein
MNIDKPSSLAFARDVFHVADTVKHLTPQQLADLETCFTAWRNAATRAASILARNRMWLIFSLLRHTGARLGEILSLDERTAFDPDKRIVRLGREERTREIPLPEDVITDATTLLASPMACAWEGRFFRVDPGYFRRICYARGKECGLPRELSGPKVLRNTRAVEMLRNGVPITVVKEILGQSSLDLTANFQQFSREDARCIVDCAQEAMRRKTSARNLFVGHVQTITSDQVMAEVILETGSRVTISAVITVASLHNLRITKGTPVIATIKAPQVTVMKSPPTLAGSARNKLPARVLRVSANETIAEILGLLKDGTQVCALVSATSAQDLALQPGDEVEFWFKALSVVLNTVQP